MKHLLLVFKYFIGWPISIIALFFIIKLIHSRSASLDLKLSDLNVFFLFSGILCFILYFFLRSFVWRQILKTKGYNIPLQEVAFLWAFAELKRYAPGKIWSLLGRTIAFLDKGVKKEDIAKSFLIEAEFLGLSSLIISLFSLTFSIQLLLPKTILIYNLITPLSMVIILILTVLFIFNTSFTKNLKKKLRFINYFLPHFSYRTNFYLLLTSILYMLLYGLGTYFSISSIFPLYTENLFIFVGFFVFSFLIGYASFITPSGLGVREGIMTVGLSRIFNLSLSGIASLYSRSILIFSELLFVAIAWIWKTTKS